MLPTLLIGPFLLLWLPMARTRRLRWLVAVGLASLTVAAALLAEAFPRGIFEIMLAALVVAVTVVAVASAAERRRLRPQPPPPRVSWLRMLFVVVLLAVLCGYGALLRPGPFFPPADAVLPLPAGLNATVEPSGDGDCGSGSCTRTITVTGRPGQSGDDLQAEVERHARTRGWTTACRPAGWLLDRTSACLLLTQQGDRLKISLSGTRP